MRYVITLLILAFALIAFDQYLARKQQPPDPD